LFWLDRAAAAEAGDEVDCYRWLAAAAAYPAEISKVAYQTTELAAQAGALPRGGPPAATAPWPAALSGTLTGFWWFHPLAVPARSGGPVLGSPFIRAAAEEFPVASAAAVAAGSLADLCACSARAWARLTPAEKDVLRRAAGMGDE
jgi:hypothetical protein